MDLPIERAEGPEMLTKDQVEPLYRTTSEAAGLPGSAYSSEAFAEAERKKLFANTWMCAGYAHEIAEPGDILPLFLAGAPILFVRTRAGDLRCFHNICTRRGCLLVPEAKTGVQTVACRYHGWMFDLDGNLRAIPHWGGHNQPDADGFDRACHGLQPVAMAQWHDWLFVNLDGNAPPFEEHAALFLLYFPNTIWIKPSGRRACLLTSRPTGSWLPKTTWRSCIFRWFTRC